MTQRAEEPTQRWVEVHYRLWDGLPDLIEHWVALAAAQAGGAASFEPSAGGPLAAALAIGRLGTAGRGDDSPLELPVRYQAIDYGTLTLSPAPDERERCEEHGRELAKGLAYEIRRLGLTAAARTRFGRELPIVGPSAALRRVDRFVEQASRSTLPVLLIGVEGAETEAIALALHLAGTRAERRFVQVRCSVLERSTLEAQLAGYLAAADGGTLVLSGLDELAPGCQLALCQLLDGAGLAPEEGGSSASGSVAWIATATPELEGAVLSGLFYRPLFDRLDILRLATDPLQRRRADIVPLFEHCFRQLAPDRALTLSKDVLTIVRGYAWPGDVAELRRVAARLAVMADDDEIQLRHLRQLAPQVLASPRSAAAAGPVAMPPQSSGVPAAPLAPNTASKQATPDFAVLPSLLAARHPSVRRALAFLSANYERKISLAEVARYSYVSASRLAHLFRQDLGITLTQVLTRVRIEKAKRILVAQPWEPITSVAGVVGFSDLRHFERIFKAAVACTPKEYRRLYVEPRQPRHTTGALDLREMADLGLTGEPLG